MYRTKVKTKKATKSASAAPLRSESTSASNACKKGKSSSASEAREKVKEKRRRAVVKEEGKDQGQSAGGETWRGAVRTGGTNDGLLGGGEGGNFATPTPRKVIPWLDGSGVGVQRCLLVFKRHVEGLLLLPLASLLDVKAIVDVVVVV